MTTIQLEPESSEGPILTGSWKLAEDGKEEVLPQEEETHVDENSETNNPLSRDEAPNLTFQDHYSLGLTPPSTVIFRGRRIRVYESHNEQFLLEEIDASILKLRRVSTGSLGQNFLRFSYTLIAIFMSGFLFVFCFQIALLIMMNLPVESGASELSDLDGSVLAGTFFAIPVLLYGMAHAMTLAVAFVTDTWQGGQLVRSLTRWPPYVREWVAFTVFLGVPALVMAGTLFAAKSDWWETTARVWVACVCLAFSFFCVGVILREVFLCWLVVAEYGEFLFADFELQPKSNGDESGCEGEQDLQPSRLRRWWEILHQSFLISQAHRYSGVVVYRYTVSGKDIASDAGATNGHYSFSENSTPDKTQKGLYSRFVSFSFFKGIFDKLDPPARLFTVDEIRDVEPILTRQNWSLETMCCRDSRRSTIMAARGPASLRHKQALSSFACSIVGSLLILLLLAGFLVWANLDVILVVLLTMLVFICCLLPMVKDSFSLYRTYEGIYGGTVGDDHIADVDETIFQVWETKCLVRPRPLLCYATFIAELALFFLWPLGNLYKNNSVSMATCFFVVAFLSFFRIYFNVGAVLARTGMVSFRQQVGARDRKPEETLLAQARTSEIIGSITENRSVIRWMYVFGAVSFLLYIAYISAVGETSDVSPNDRPEILLSAEFYYPKPKDENLSYPSCKLTNVFQEDDESGTGFVQLIDFAFLSALAYEDQENAQDLVDIWFGEGYLIDESEFVYENRMQSGSHKIPVWYKLFRLNTTRTDGRNTGIVAVRGTESDIDWLVNMQLWLSSMMAEVVKNIVPFGFLFEPIIDDMVTVVNVIQSESLKKISYYSEVARFCRDVLDQGYYDQLRLTGASLGGGTAMIAGAQTKVLTVAISGPNAVLARRTFDPPLSLDVLNKYVFNVIPDRDPIAAIGGRARLFQEIACSAQSNDFFGCHSMWRTVCETAFTCGAENRPALCMCVERFGYPLPLSRGTLNETFEELCGIE